MDASFYSLNRPFSCNLPRKQKKKEKQRKIVMHKTTSVVICSLGRLDCWIGIKGMLEKQLRKC